jgi:hypothetical protein
MLARRFRMAVKRFGLNKPHAPLDITKFKRPPRAGEQLTLI